jgi:vacuolar protein sorting-associated protein 16
VNSSKRTFRYILSPPERIISRLTARSLHLLAFQVSGFLGLKPDGVLKHWASSKIAAPAKTAPGETAPTDAERDEDLCNAIVEKFEKYGGKGISYSEVARRAWEVGRSSLATKVRMLWWSLMKTD